MLELSVDRVLMQSLQLGIRTAYARSVSVVRRRRLAWPLWWTATVVALVALFAGALWSRAADREAADLQVALAAIRAEADHAAAAVKPGAPPINYTAALPRAAPMDKLLREAFKTAARLGVTVVSAEPQEPLGGQPNSLASATLVLRLTGPYSGIKAVLAELLARFPGLTVQHLRIQRSTTAGGVQEASVTLQQWLRPQPPLQHTAARAGG